VNESQALHHKFVTIGTHIQETPDRALAVQAVRGRSLKATSENSLRLVESDSDRSRARLKARIARIRFAAGSASPEPGTQTDSPLVGRCAKNRILAPLRRAQAGTDKDRRVGDPTR